jgi:hypothetical protein
MMPAYAMLRSLDGTFDRFFYFLLGLQVIPADENAAHPFAAFLNRSLHMPLLGSSPAATYLAISNPATGMR